MRKAKGISTAETALDLADKAERGDTHAAYQLACLMDPGSVTELLEFIAPTGPITTIGFDAAADGFHLATYMKEKR